MGLDVYMYRYQDFDATQTRETNYEKESEANWERVCQGREYKELTETEKDQVRAMNEATAARLGLDSDGSDPAREKVEIDSRIYPEHYFKIGYCRSSYNSGGINRILKDAIGKDLYYIFDRERDEGYTFRPDWPEVKSRAIESLESLKAAIARDGGAHNVLELTYNEFLGGPNDQPVDGAEKALEVFRKQVAQQREYAEKNPDYKPYSYSNRDGEFFMDQPLKIKAAIPGVRGRLFGAGKLPAFYVIYEADWTWYLQALEIVIEMCDWVSDQPDKDKLYLHWSS